MTDTTHPVSTSYAHLEQMVLSMPLAQTLGLRFTGTTPGHASVCHLRLCGSGSSGHVIATWTDQRHD